jgi:integrase
MQNMASVRKRVQGTKVTWLVDYFDQDGKRHNKTFETQREAKEWRDRAVIEVKDGVHTPSADSITVAEAGKLWLDQGKTEGLECGTLKQYEQHLRLHIGPYIGRVKLAHLTPAHVQRLRDKLVEEGRSRDMVRRVVVSLGALLSSAISYGKVAKNVVHDAARLRTRRDRRLDGRHERRLEVGVDIPTKDEIRAMLSAADGRWRPLIVTVVFTGLRASELRGLTWDDVDLKAETLTVRQRADLWNTIGSPKSSSGKRTIPLAPIVVNTLREWRLTCPKGELGLVFPNTAGKIERLETIRRLGLGPLQVKAGITTDQRRLKYGLHALRHTAASLFIEEGWNAKRVQAVMGHSTIAMTMDVYGHLFPNPEDDREAMRRLQARLIG